MVEYMDTDLGLSTPERAIDRKHILLDLIDNDMGSFEKLWAFYRKLKCSKIWLASKVWVGANIVLRPTLCTLWFTVQRESRGLTTIPT